MNTFEFDGKTYQTDDQIMTVLNELIPAVVNSKDQDAAEALRAMLTNASENGQIKEDSMEQLERVHETAHEAITEIVVNDDRSDGVTMLKDVLRALEAAGFPTDADPWETIAYHTDDMAHTPQWVDVDDLADALRQARTLALGRMGKLYCDSCRTFYEPKRRPHCHTLHHPAGWQAGEHGEWACPTCVGSPATRKDQAMTIERIPVFKIVEQTDAEIVVEVFGDKARLEQKRIPRPAVVEVYDTITDNGWSIIEMDEDAAIEHGLL